MPGDYRADAEAWVAAAGMYEDGGGSVAGLYGVSFGASQYDADEEPSDDRS